MASEPFAVVFLLAVYTWVQLRILGVAAIGASVLVYITAVESQKQQQLIL